MKYVKRIFLIAITLLVIIGCWSGLHFIGDEGSGIDVPNNATGGEIQLTCGSEYCTKLLSYNIDGNVEDLIQFYREQGYTCFERETNRNSPPAFDAMPTPYWDCSKQTPKALTILGFRKEPQSTTIHILIQHGWSPAL